MTAASLRRSCDAGFHARGRELGVRGAACVHPYYDLMKKCPPLCGHARGGQPQEGGVGAVWLPAAGCCCLYDADPRCRTWGSVGAVRADPASCRLRLSGCSVRAADARVLGWPIYPVLREGRIVLTVPSNVARESQVPRPVMEGMRVTEPSLHRGAQAPGRARRLNESRPRGVPDRSARSCTRPGRRSGCASPSSLGQPPDTFPTRNNLVTTLTSASVNRREHCLHAFVIIAAASTCPSLA